jgi:hypothetical protein
VQSDDGIASATVEVPLDAIEVPTADPWPEVNDPGPFDGDEAPDPTNRSARKNNDIPRAGAPRLDEWQDFFARVVIKGITERWVDHAFRDVDEDKLTDRELRRLYLAPDERERIARPLSELANKNKFTRRHGRTIIAAADSVDSVMALALWFGRVNRIASKYSGTRPVKGSVVKDERTPPFEGNGTNGQANGYEHGFAPWPESPGTG